MNVSWYVGFVISFAIGMGFTLGFYLRCVRVLDRRTDNLNAWEDELCRRENEVEDRCFDLMEREGAAVHAELTAAGK
jgi:hypothetical protein